MLIDLYKDNENINIFLFDLTGETLSKSEIFNLKSSKYKEIELYIKPNEEI